MKPYLTALGFTALTSLLAGCATTDTRIPSLAQLLGETTQQKGRACIRQRSIRGYAALEDQILSIDGGTRHYLATVLPGCLDLSTSMRVAFSSDSFEVCGGRFDKVLTDDNDCTIDQIFEFKNREEALSIYRQLSEQRQQLKAQPRDQSP